MTPPDFDGAPLTSPLKATPPQTAGATVAGFAGAARADTAEKGLSTSDDTMEIGGQVYRKDPAREPCFRIVRGDSEMATFAGWSPEARRERLHRHMHNELGSLEIAAQTLADFPEAPWELRMELARQCWDETRHVRALHGRLKAAGGRKGEFPVATLEWRVTCALDTLAARLAVQNRTFEAGQMDLVRRHVEEWREAGDEETAEILDAILSDEIQHVRFANRWVRRLVERDRRLLLKVASAVQFLSRAIDPVHGAFGSGKAAPRGGPAQIPGINVEDRRLAGFTEKEILEVLTQASRSSSGPEVGDQRHAPPAGRIPTNATPRNPKTGAPSDAESPGRASRSVEPCGETGPRDDTDVSSNPGDHHRSSPPRGKRSDGMPRGPGSRIRASDEDTVGCGRAERPFEPDSSRHAPSGDEGTVNGGCAADLFGPEPARDARLDVRQRWADCVNLPDDHPDKKLEFLHRQLNEEINGLENSARCLADFPEAGWEIRMQIARQCADEARHVLIFRRILEARGGRIGAWPVMNFQYRIVNQIDNLAGRLAVQNRAFEAEGIDAIRFGIDDCAASGDAEMAALLDAQLADEIGHVRYANEWLRREIRDEPATAIRVARAITRSAEAFRAVMGEEGANVVKYLVDPEGRLEAGFLPGEVEIADKAVRARRRPNA